MTHQVRHTGKRLAVATVDLAGEIDDLKVSIERIALCVRSLRDKALARAAWVPEPVPLVAQSPVG